MPARERIKGYSDEDIIGQHFSKFYFDGGPGGRTAGPSACHRSARGAL